MAFSLICGVLSWTFVGSEQQTDLVLDWQTRNNTIPLC